MRSALNSSQGAACLQVLQQHRNFEWAIKYLLVESQDYTQLMTAGEADRALGDAAPPATWDVAHAHWPRGHAVGALGGCGM